MYRRGIVGCLQIRVTFCILILAWTTSHTVLQSRGFSFLRIHKFVPSVYKRGESSNFMYLLPKQRNSKKSLHRLTDQFQILMGRIGHHNGLCCLYLKNAVYRLTTLYNQEIPKKIYLPSVYIQFGVSAFPEHCGQDGALYVRTVEEILRGQKLFFVNHISSIPS